MSESFFSTEWRPKNPRIRRFLAKYLRWMIWLGYLFALFATIGLILAFVVRQEVTVATTPDEPGTLEAASMVYTVPALTCLHEARVANGAVVKRGQTIAYIYTGSDLAPVASAYRQLRERTPQSPLVAELRQRLLARPPESVRSTADGVILWSTASQAGLIEPKGELFRIQNYGRIIAKGRLRGNTIADAAVGQTAMISAFDFNRDTKDLLRGTATEVGQELSFGSRRVLDGSVERLLNEHLVGEQFAVRNDRTFTFDRVALAEVEVQLKGQSSSNTDGLIQMDPVRDFQLPGTVTDGIHRAKVQFRSLPAKAQSALTDLLNKRLVGSQLEVPTTADTSSLRGSYSVEQVQQAMVIVQAEAQAPPSRFGPQPPGINASPLDRYFDVEVVLPNPPTWLVSAIRANDALRRATRTKIEVVTGTQPYAMQLLRR